MRLPFDPGSFPRWMAVLAATTPASAFAYVDPGSGMLLWQGLIAAVGAVLIFVRNPREQIRKWLARLKRRK